MAWWYAASFDAEHWQLAESKDNAIDLGAADVEPGEKYCIGEGESQSPWPQLFDDASELADFIDDRNEERSFEDTFLVEAGISQAELEPLLDTINQAWTDFLALHKPTSRSLDFTNQEEVTRPAA